MTMRYKLLGRTGLRISELALGAMTFGDQWGWGASPQECARMLEAYGEAGGNVIDTANHYTHGESERIVGGLIGSERDRWVLCTKYVLNQSPADPNAGGSHRKSLVRSLEASLNRLGTDYVDVLWVHIWDAFTPVEELMRALDDMVRAGKVLYVGISDTPAWIVCGANTVAQLRGWTPFAGLQVPYSLVERSVEREASASQVAIAWVRAQQPRATIVPILGARTREQLEDNLAALRLQLSSDELARLNAVSRIELGFPHDFDADRLAYGDTRELIDDHRHAMGAAA